MTGPGRTTRAVRRHTFDSISRRPHTVAADGCIFALPGASMLAVLLLDWLVQSLRGNPQQKTTY